MNKTSLLDYREKLMEVAHSQRDSYRSNQPFPHIVLDNLFPASILAPILDEFPKPDFIDWIKFDTAAEKKQASRSELQMGPVIRSLLYELNSSTFIDFLEQLTGIEGLIPDPHFVGGGLHQIVRGGFLKIHADFNRHTRLKLDRRINLLIYLNKDWKEEYGGHLQLWDSTMSHCEKKILPIFNRCVIFNTTDFAFHGHPDPLACPEGWSRKSLAMYYYSNGRPPEEIRPPHTTLFQKRPGEDYQIHKSNDSFKAKIKRFISPDILDIVRRPKK